MVKAYCVKFTLYNITHQEFTLYILDVLYFETPFAMYATWRAVTYVYVVVGTGYGLGLGLGLGCSAYSLLQRQRLLASPCCLKRLWGLSRQRGTGGYLHRTNSVQA